jgi:hypothetical protein
MFPARVVASFYRADSISFKRGDDAVHHALMMRCDMTSRSMDGSLARPMDRFHDQWITGINPSDQKN